MYYFALKLIAVFVLSITNLFGGSLVEGSSFYFKKQVYWHSKYNKVQRTNDLIFADKFYLNGTRYPLRSVDVFKRTNRKKECITIRRRAKQVGKKIYLIEVRYISPIYTFFGVKCFRSSIRIKSQRHQQVSYKQTILQQNDDDSLKMTITSIDYNDFEAIPQLNDSEFYHELTTNIKIKQFINKNYTYLNSNIIKLEYYQFNDVLQLARIFHE